MKPDSLNLKEQLHRLELMRVDLQAENITLKSENLQLKCHMKDLESPLFSMYSELKKAET